MPRCPECDAKVSSKDKRCPECGEKLKASGVERVVPYRNLPALVGYYVGVGALIPYVAFILGPIAILLGIFGFVYGSQNPRAKAPGHCITAIVLSLIGLVGTGVMIFLVHENYLADPRDRIFGPNPNRMIVGKWEANDKGTKIVAEFNKGGTAKLTMSDMPIEGTYKIRGSDELEWTLADKTATFKMMLTATEMQLTGKGPWGAAPLTFRKL